MAVDESRRGRSLSTRELLAWSERVLAAARTDAARLRRRGISERELSDLRAARRLVRELDLAQEGRKRLAAAMVHRRRRAIADALDWRREVKGLAAAVLTDRPASLARFRTGLRGERTLPKLIAEIELLVEAVKDNGAALLGVGVDPAHGRRVLRQLRQAQQDQAAERVGLSGASGTLFRAQSRLYARVLRVCRIAQVEFRRTPRMARRYPPFRRHR